MSLIRVDLNKRVDKSYDVEVAIGARESLVKDVVKMKENKRFVIISDSRVANLHGGDLFEELRAKGVECDLLTFAAGERAKNWNTAVDLARQMLQKGYSRSDMIIALGGGVTGDLAGFVASMFMRGIRFVQVPTSLLAMTDAAIGGKTGVNVPEGKNLLGSFYQPDKVYVDVQFLKTLPKKDMKNGYAEIVKHAVLADKGLFRTIESASQDELFSNLEFINDVLVSSCAVKADIVTRDERESSLRMKLNLGHTIGHALEKEMEYKIDHGKAVSIGLSKICDVAVIKKMLSEKDCVRIKAVLKHIGLPIELPKSVDRRRIVEAMSGDKKVRDKKLHFIVPVSVGEVVIDTSITDKEVLEVL